MRTVNLGTHAGWMRFQDYASLVRRLTIDPFVDDDTSTSRPPLITDSVWCQLTTPLGRMTILPHLKVVTMKSVVDHGRSLDTGTLCLVSPGIRELTIDFARSWTLPHRDLTQDMLQTSFASLFTSTPNLEKLVVRSAVPILVWKSLPPSHARLRQLKVTTALRDLDDLLHLTSLPNLEHLTCHIEIRKAYRIGPIRFEKLHTLFVAGYWRTANDDILAHIEAPRLRVLAAQGTKFLGSAERIPQKSSQHFRTVATTFRSITSFSWLCSQMRWVGGPPLWVDIGATLAELLEPLSPLRTLRRVTVRFCGPTIVPYSSSDLEWIANTWPELEAFTFILDRIVADRDVTIETLASFTQRCSRLHYLRIPQITYNYAGDADVGRNPQLSSILCKLVISNVFWKRGQEEVPKAEEELLTLLSRLFPSALISIPRCTQWRTS